MPGGARPAAAQTSRRCVPNVRMSADEFTVAVLGALHLDPRKMEDYGAGRGRAAAGRGRLHAPRAFKNDVSLGSKRLPLVPLSACARVCRLHSH